MPRNYRDIFIDDEDILDYFEKNCNPVKSDFKSVSYDCPEFHCVDAVSRLNITIMLFVFMNCVLILYFSYDKNFDEETSEEEEEDGVYHKL